MQTVSKSYVDTAIAAAVTGHPLDSTPYVLKAGDTMAGPLLLPADPVSPAQAADKHYVDASVAALSGGLGQGAATPPQTQYAVPAYLLSPSGGLALPGASHLSVDPTGYNLERLPREFHQPRRQRLPAGLHPGRRVVRRQLLPWRQRELL